MALVPTQTAINIPSQIPTDFISKDVSDHANVQNMLLAALGLSMWALNSSNGNFSTGALIAYTLVCGLLLRLMGTDRPSVISTWGVWNLGFLNLLFMRHQFYMMFFAENAYTSMGQILKMCFFVGWMAQCPWLFRWKHPISRRVLDILGVCGVVAAVTFLCLTIIAVPVPPTDVYYFQHEAVAGFLKGLNPYELTFTNIYGPQTIYYPGGVPIAYPYPPFSLFLSLPLALTGDVRWELLLCHVAACGIFAWIAFKRGWQFRSAVMLGTIGLFQAVTPHIIRHSWTEPRMALGLACVLLMWEGRRMKWASFLAGGLFALKQYLIWWVIPALAWIRDRKDRAALLRSFAVIPVVSYGMFLIWNPAELWHDLVTFHLATPFREDGLTYNAWLHWHRLPLLSGTWSAVGGAAVAAVGVLKARSPISRIATLACTLLVFFLLSKHAFSNYYYLIQMVVLSACCFAKPKIVVR